MNRKDRLAPVAQPWLKCNGRMLGDLWADVSGADCWVDGLVAKKVILWALSERRERNLPNAHREISDEADIGLLVSPRLARYLDLIKNVSSLKNSTLCKIRERAPMSRDGKFMQY